MTTSMDRKELPFRGPDLKLFVRDVRDRLRKKRAITVRSWSTIKDVKDAIQQTFHIPPQSQRLYFGPLLTSGGELPNHRTLHDAGIYRSGETLLLDIKDRNLVGSPALPSLYSFRSSDGNDVCISTSMMDLTPKNLRSLVQEARRGFALGLKPEFILDGSAGSYFLHDARKNRISVFKPADEEPYAENNPRGYLNQPGQSMSLRQGVVPGEACIREVAAYLLDHGGLSGVPMTTLAEARHPAFNTNGARLTVAAGGAAVGSHSISANSPVESQTKKKAGSFQEYIRSECTMDDISPSKISVEEVQKIAILDIRILNADRNSANLLVRRRPDNSLELVPIDHGYCLRSVSDVSWMDWCWLDWPQLKQPLSAKLREYVLNLDIEADARMLSERLNICPEAIDYFRASSYLLKAGVKAGLSLYEIAVQCCRNDNLAVVPSMLEKLIDMASELAFVAIKNERYHHSAASRALVEQLSPRHPRNLRRSSMLSRSSSSGNSSSRPLRKSASSAEFLSLRSDSLGSRESMNLGILEELGNDNDRESPAMVQSSASSDSASDEPGDGVEKEDCDECQKWAASVILDVSMDQIMPTTRSSRSGSILSDDASSDSGLSSSPKGFWTIRPGTSPIANDDASITWSMNGSPRTSIAEGSDPPCSNLDGSGHDFKSPTVTFADTAPGPYIPPPNTVNVLQFKGKESALSNSLPALERSESGMSRSKSYSALSAVDAAREGGLSGSTKSSSSIENDGTFQMYFHKFIDLVIARETAAAQHHSNQGCFELDL